ncbi:MAG: hypothetical protein ABI759_21445 [Candidatus Solibacter sp.]
MARYVQLSGSMAEESATTTYYIPESFEEAVQSVRRTLVESGLRITGELNMSERLQRRLRVHTAPCQVLFVGPAAPLRTGAAFTPLHVVISERGAHAEIHIMRVPAAEGAREGLAEIGPLRAQVAQAIERIAMRALLGV